MKILSKSAWALATVLALCSIGEAAGPLDERVPADAVVYFGWAGSDGLAAQYGASNLKGIVDASSARDFLAKALPKLTETAGRNDPEAPKIIAKWQAGLGIAWHHPCAFYLCPVDFSKPPDPQFRFGLICDAGGDAKALSDLLHEAQAGVKLGPGAPSVNVITEGNLVGLIFGKEETEAERVKDGGLGANAAYGKAMAQLKVTKPAFAVYADMPKIIGMVEQGIASDAPPEIKANAARVIDALGIRGLGQVAAASGFDGKEWSEQLFVGTNGPRQGVLSFLTAPLSDNALTIIPRDAVMFGAVKLDPHHIFTELRGILGKVDPKMLEQFDAAVADGDKQSGVKLEQDVLAALGDEWILYRAPVPDIGGYSFALMQKLRDADRFGRVVAQIESMVNAMGQGQFKIDHMTGGKIEYSSVSFLSYSLAWAVRNGYLYVSTVEGLPGAVKQVENKLPNITESDLYKKALAALPPGVKPLALGYSNPAKTYPEMRRSLLGIMPLVRTLNLGIEIPVTVFPDVDDITPFLTPGANVAWVDADGLHMAGHSAFPGADILGGSPGGGPTIVAAGAVATAVALPAIAKARESARRVTDAANLKGISMFCMMYNANNNQMPDSLARLIVDGTMDPRFISSPRTGAEPFVLTPELRKLANDDFAKFSQEIAQRSDYVYVGKSMSMTDPGASLLVITYARAATGTRDGINAAFMDGHVEFISWRGLEQSFAHTNEVLKAKGLPPIDTTAMLRQVGVPAPAAAAPGGGRP